MDITETTAPETLAPAPADRFRFAPDPFRHWILNSTSNPTPGANLIPPAADSPVWEAAYSNDLESGKRTTRDVFGLPGFRSLFHWLLSDAWRDRWRKITGIADLEPDRTLHGAGLQVTEGGGWLNCHLDYARHPVLPDTERRLSVVMFLTGEWRESWGGALQLCDAVAKPVEKIYPAAGRIVAFENTDVAYHGVEDLAPEAPERVTACVFFVAPSRAGATRQRALFMPNRSRVRRCRPGSNQ